MSIQLRAAFLIGVLVYFGTIVKMLGTKHLKLKYTLTWIFGGILMLLLVIFPKILVWFADLCKIEAPSNGLFAILFLAVFIILISLTSYISQLSEKNRMLAQEISLLEYRIRQLEKETGRGELP